MRPRLRRVEVSLGRLTSTSRVELTANRARQNRHRVVTQVNPSESLSGILDRSIRWPLTQSPGPRPPRLTSCHRHRMVPSVSGRQTRSRTWPFTKVTRIRSGLSNGDLLARNSRRQAGTVPRGCGSPIASPRCECLRVICPTLTSVEPASGSILGPATDLTFTSNSSA